jgi:hypothetical protein
MAGAKGAIETYPSGAEGIRGELEVGVSPKTVYGADGRVMRAARKGSGVKLECYAYAYSYSTIANMRSTKTL